MSAAAPLGPLAGISVVELAGLGPAPFACMLLADLGADVIRIDRPQASELDLPPQFELLNRGKRSIVVDLKKPQGTALALRLLESADILIEGYRPGVAEKLGLGPDIVLTRNPRLVYGRMTGWGQDGPRAQEAGHDISYIAVTGALHAIGDHGGPPAIPVNLLGDFGGGAMYLAVGVLAALLEARSTGAGQVVDAAIVDGTVHLTTLLHGMLAAGLWTDRRGENTLDGGAPFYCVYETRDGRHMAVGALEAKFYRSLLDVLGLDEDPATQNDPHTWPGLRLRMAGAFAGRTQAEWIRAFAGSDACVSPVRSLVEAASDVHLSARRSLLVVDGIAQPGTAPRFSSHEDLLPRPPAAPGSHTRSILEELDLDSETLLASGIVSQART